VNNIPEVQVKQSAEGRTKHKNNFEMSNISNWLLSDERNRRGSMDFLFHPNNEL
jgi:hypothetical protein